MNSTMTSNWVSYQSFAPGTHASVRESFTRQNVETPVQPVVDLASLQPGDCVSFSTEKSTEPKVSWTNDDRLDFRNGGRIEDKPNEGGLLITSPDGRRSEVPGFLHQDPETDSVIAVWHAEDPLTGDMEEFEQHFPSDGGAVLKQEDNLYFAMTPGGQATGSLYAMGNPVASVQHGAAVLSQGNHHVAVAPPVPLDWLVAKN